MLVKIIVGGMLILVILFIFSMGKISKNQDDIADKLEDKINAQV